MMSAYRATFRSGTLAHTGVAAHKRQLSVVCGLAYLLRSRQARS